MSFKPARPFFAPSNGLLRWKWAWPTLTFAALATVTWVFFPQNLKDLTRRLGSETSEPMQWQLVLDPRLDAAAHPGTDPEHLVRQVYAHLGEGERAKALATANVLAIEFPTFQLGQLIYADLLNISSLAPVEVPEMQSDAQPSFIKRLNELVLESKRRINHSNPVLAGKIPSALAFLSADQPYVMAIDASESRLYWFENKTGPDGSLQLQLIKEVYISVGLNGVGKEREGDGKTPLGVYFIQKGLPGKTLPDLFGSGALTLNYPNAIDNMRKKSGSGIWLHGTPSAQYSRAPQATDGCVVLSNPDMDQMLGLPGLRMTPVVIAEKLDWVSLDQHPQAFADFKPALESWLQARNGKDAELLRSHYSLRFTREDMNLDQLWPRIVATSLGRHKSLPLEVVSALQWQDQDNTMVVTMKDPNQKANSVYKYLRTYWQKENNQWKLVFEGPT